MMNKRSHYDEMVIVEFQLTTIRNKVKSFKILKKTTQLMKALDLAVRECEVLKEEFAPVVNVPKKREPLTIAEKIDRYAEIVLSLKLPPDVEGEIIKLKNFKLYTKSEVKERIILSEIRRLSLLSRIEIIRMFKDSIYKIRFNSFFNSL